MTNEICNNYQEYPDLSSRLRKKLIKYLLDLDNFFAEKNKESVTYLSKEISDIRINLFKKIFSNLQLFDWKTTQILMPEINIISQNIVLDMELASGGNTAPYNYRKKQHDQIHTMMICINNLTHILLNIPDPILDENRSIYGTNRKSPTSNNIGNYRNAFSFCTQQKHHCWHPPKLLKSSNPNKNNLPPKKRHLDFIKYFASQNPVLIKSLANEFHFESTNHQLLREILNHPDAYQKLFMSLLDEIIAINTDHLKILKKYQFHITDAQRTNVIIQKIFTEPLAKKEFFEFALKYKTSIIKGETLSDYPYKLQAIQVYSDNYYQNALKYFIGMQECLLEIKRYYSPAPNNPLPSNFSELNNIDELLEIFSNEKPDFRNIILQHWENIKRITLTISKQEEKVNPFLEKVKKLESSPKLFHNYNNLLAIFCEFTYSNNRELRKVIT